jgi:mono/diheme cytochrome c family protein
LLADTCGACHTGGDGFGGLDLSSYEATLEGGNSGPGIVPNDPEDSVVYTLQLEGGHPGQLSDDQLADLLEWIETGAPETDDLTWDGELGALLADTCGACHQGSSGLGGLDLSAYDKALEGGNSGPGIVPGDPDASAVYTRQLPGGHPGQLDDDQLFDLLAWIEAGAPED